jgi:uncharacterized protein YaiE (UPF0345 family)
MTNAAYFRAADALSRNVALLTVNSLFWDRLLAGRKFKTPANNEFKAHVQQELENNTKYHPFCSF